ncbi:ATP-binding cassette domain-containing protein [Maricaulis sp.]|uniref:type I secretion system permease/ATPase n=1 Tax=Maricaulis sp. TaxID=1486257 RepID=UPI0026267F56|nr:ATP-binding cassette domain-containing protein [Maricaulis sp.]
MSKPLTLEIRSRLRPHLRWLAGFSLAVNILLLVSPLYMLQVYDRVLSSGSYDTLIWLSILAVFLLAIYGAAEIGRRRVLALAGVELEARLGPRIFAQFESQPAGRAALAQNLSRMSRIQSYLQNGAALPFADLPFAPLFLLVLFLIHPVIGMIGLAGAAIVFGVAVAAELTSRQTSAVSQSILGQSTQLASDFERQRSALVAMGLIPGAFRRWRQQRDQGQALGLNAARLDGRFTGISRSTRQVLQILVLGGGAALALSQQISPGSIVASSIILARVLGPIDQIVGGWRNSVLTWNAWKDLQASIEGMQEAAEFTPLPRPEAELEIDRLCVAVPGRDAPLIQPFSFRAEGGQIIVLAGAIGAGKSSLLQTLSGAWPAADGSVSLGQRAMQDWASADRGRYVGYVPQDVELLPATIAENINRLTQADADETIKAAKLAGAHEMILTLAEGYDTLIGPGGAQLSAGQAQLVGLARALFGSPPLVLLDEPTANLDSATAAHLIKAIGRVAEAGAVVFVSTHDRRVIEQAHTVLLLRKGSVLAAPAEQYLKLAVGPGSGSPSGKGAA